MPIDFFLALKCKLNNRFGLETGLINWSTTSRTSVSETKVDIYESSVMLQISQERFS